MYQARPLTTAEACATVVVWPRQASQVADDLWPAGARLDMRREKLR
jgi:hypothetical protein